MLSTRHINIIFILSIHGSKQSFSQLIWKYNKKTFITINIIDTKVKMFILSDLKNSLIRYLEFICLYL